MTDDAMHAEQVVIGCAMTDPTLMPDLAADEFYRPQHGSIWTLIQRMVSDGKPITPQTVALELAETPIPPVDGSYLHTCFALVTVPEAVAFYAAIVRDAADLRAIHAAGQRMMQATTISDGQNAKSHARQTLDGLDLREAGDGSKHIADVIHDVITAIETGTEPGLSTPWSDLDYKLGGLKPGTSTVIAARPGLGKSIIGLQVAAHVALKHGPVLFHSLEMSTDELGRRLLSSTSQVEYTSLSKRPNDLEWARVARVIPNVDRLPLTIDDKATITVAEIAASARRHARNGLRLLVVDYLQLVSPLDRRMPREQQVAEVSRSLKILAKDLGIAVVVLAQLNRESEKRATGKPVLSDLRESGSVEQDADAVLLLWRDVDAKGDAANVLEVSVAKNRGGPLGSVDLHWDAKHMRVTSSARWSA